MKCPKCGYTSFDYLMECKKCGEILEDSRRALNLRMNEPTIFTNLEEKDEPTYSNEDDLRIAESLGDSDIAQESIVLGDFQPPPLDNIPDDIPETANELESDMQLDDFDLELDTLTPLSEGGTGKAGDITFDGFAGGEESPKVDPGVAPAEKNSLLESNSMPEASGATPESGDFNLDMELPFDFSGTDTLKSEAPAAPETDEPAGVVELNLDDDESLDKILADLDSKDDK